MPSTTAERVDVSVIADLLGPDPDLFAEKLPDEHADDLLVRRAAAADITDDLVATWRTEAAAEVAVWKAEAELEVALWQTEAEAQVVEWLDDIRRAAA